MFFLLTSSYKARFNAINYRYRYPEWTVMNPCPTCSDDDSGSIRTYRGIEKCVADIIPSTHGPWEFEQFNVEGKRVDTDIDVEITRTTTSRTKNLNQKLSKTDLLYFTYNDTFFKETNSNSLLGSAAGCCRVLRVNGGYWSSMIFTKRTNVVNRHPVWISSSTQSGSYKAIWFDGDFAQPSWRMGEFTHDLQDEDYYKSVYRTNVYATCPTEPRSSTFGWLEYQTSNTYSNYDIDPVTINIDCGKSPGNFMINLD